MSAINRKKRSPLSRSASNLSNSFTSIGEYSDLSKQVEDLVLNNSGKELIGLTLEDLMEECGTSGNKIQHVLARLGTKVKRTTYGTYFHMSCIHMVPKKKKAKLFY